MSDGPGGGLGKDWGCALHLRKAKDALGPDRADLRPCMAWAVGCCTVCLHFHLCIDGVPIANEAKKKLKEKDEETQRRVEEIKQRVGESRAKKKKKIEETKEEKRRKLYKKYEVTFAMRSSAHLNLTAPACTHIRGSPISLTPRSGSGTRTRTRTSHGW